MNTLETKGKKRKSQQRKRRYKEEPNRYFRTKKYDNQNEKTQWMCSTGEWRVTEGRISFRRKNWKKLYWF